MRLPVPRTCVTLPLCLCSSSSARSAPSGLPSARITTGAVRLGEREAWKSCATSTRRREALLSPQMMTCGVSSLPLYLSSAVLSYHRRMSSATKVGMMVAAAMPSTVRKMGVATLLLKPTPGRPMTVMEA